MKRGRPKSQRKCIRKSCSRKHSAKDLCRSHYIQRKYRLDSEFRRKRNAVKKEWYKKNKDRVKEYVSRWRKKNPEKAYSSVLLYQIRNGLKGDTHKRLSGLTTSKRNYDSMNRKFMIRFVYHYLGWTSVQKTLKLPERWSNGLD